METNDCNMLFQGDEEDLDDTLPLVDLRNITIEDPGYLVNTSLDGDEAHTTFYDPENCLRNVTIKDPGYVVNTSLEDYEVRIKESLLKIKDMRKPRKGYLYAKKYSNLLSKCRSCSIRVVDFHKFPWYYQNKFVSSNKIQNSNREYNVIEIEEEKEDEVIIVDLLEKEHVQCNKLYDNRGRNVNKNRRGKHKDDGNDVTSIENSVGRKVTKQIDETSNVQNGGVEQASDLIISTYTKIIDKAIQKIKTKIESCPNNKNLTLDNKLLLRSNSYIINPEYLSQNTTNFVTPKVKSKISNDDNYYGTNYHNRKENGKKSNKIKNIYTSEQITKTKIRIKIDSLKSKAIISNINDHNNYEDRVFNMNPSVTNKKQYDYLKMLKTKHNSFTNKKHNYFDNKGKRIGSNSSLQPCTVLPKIINETKIYTSLPNGNISSCKNNVCDKQLFSAHRIIPHFHEMPL